MSKFSDILVALRRDNRITQVDKAKRLNVARQTYLNLELGETEPRYSTIIECAKIFNVQCSIFFDGFKNTENPKLLTSCTDAELCDEIKRRLIILR